MERGRKRERLRQERWISEGTNPNPICLLFHASFIVSVVYYCIVFSANHGNPSESCLAPHRLKRCNIMGLQQVEGWRRKVKGSGFWQGGSNRATFQSFYHRKTQLYVMQLI